jgi:hypothetical protein
VRRAGGPIRASHSKSYSSTKYGYADLSQVVSPVEREKGDQFGRLFDVALDTFVNMDRSDIVIIERELDLVVMTMKAWASAKFKFNANRIHRYSFMDGLSYFAWGPPGETTSG